VKSPQTNFLVAAAFGVAGTLYFALFGRDLPALTPNAPPPAEAT
jgi:hypothetical protein